MNCTILALVNDLHLEQDIQNYLIYKYWRDERQDEHIVPTLIYSTNLVHKRAPGYYEDWLQEYLERDFFNLFRLSRNTFVGLLSAINCPERQFVGGEQPVSVEKCLLMFLWWLGKGDTLISVSDRFNVALSTVYNAVEFIIPKILGLQKKYISWPNHQEALDIERAFRAKSGFPGVIGAIDGCNIKFKCPNQQQESYVDKNRNHSIKLQGIVTEKKIFTNIMVGFPGSAHDSRVFQNSIIYSDVEENGMINKYFFDDFHLVGDKAYSLRKWIMTPYKDERYLDGRQLHYNTIHSRTRIAVEHTFGILKSRWKILKSINVNSIEKAIKIIAASCVIHNFCYVHSDIWDEFEIMPVENNPEGLINMERVGIVKRDNIANDLWRDR